MVERRELLGLGRGGGQRRDQEMLDGGKRENVVGGGFGGRVGRASQGEEVQRGGDGKDRSLEIARLWRERLKTDSGEGGA